MDLTHDLEKRFFPVKTLKKNEGSHVMQGFLKNDFAHPLVMKKIKVKPTNSYSLKAYNLLEKSETYLKEHLKSPIIPTLVAKENRTGKIFIMESYIPGITLNQLFYMKNKGNKWYEKFKMGFVISQKENYYTLKETLEGFHGKKIIHGDIHLKNLMINEEGRIYMIDFNSSIVGDEINQTVLKKLKIMEQAQFKLVWKKIEKNLYI